MTPEQAAALRAPFPPEAIGKLPKAGIKLDYVGHAGVTDRLLAVDPEWTWEPAAVNEFGVPLITAGGLWIKLTVCGVTRYGWGDGPDIKQMISDAIRNTAMRFGVALDLWSKEDLHAIQQDAEAKTEPIRAGQGDGASSDPSAASATSPAGTDFEHPAAANGGDVSSSPPTSKNQFQRCQSKLKQLLADSAKVADRRKAAGLPLLTSECTAAELDGWERLLDEIDAELTAPFERASA